MKPQGIQVNQNKILFYMVTQHLRLRHLTLKRKRRRILPGQILLGDNRGNIILSIIDAEAIAEDIVWVHYHVNTHCCYDYNFCIQPVYVGKHIHLAHLN